MSAGCECRRLWSQSLRSFALHVIVWWHDFISKSMSNNPSSRTSRGDTPSYRAAVAEAAAAAAQVRSCRSSMRHTGNVRHRSHSLELAMPRAFLTQSAGFGHVERALCHLEAREVEEHMWPDVRGPPEHFVTPLLPVGSLSITGGPWQRYEPSGTAAAPPRQRPPLASPARFGWANGFTPRQGLYH